MNCFEWQQVSSDHVDGLLPPPLKIQADQHVSSCPDCSEHSKHFRSIVSSISKLPQMQVPAAVRKAPFTATLPKTELTQTGRSRWERLPWYLRTTIEGSTIVFLILLGISTGPKIRQLYEKSLERSLSEFSDAMNLSENGKPGDLPPLQGPATTAGAPGSDEFSGEDESSQESDDEDSTVTDAEENIRVGKSEIWRFNLKTDSPDEVRPTIVQTLTDLRVPSTTPGLGGLKAPGGIQFDLFVPQSTIPSIKRQLQKLAPKATELENTNFRETFTWYKVKSRKKIPDGMTRVVIWLSQI